MTYLPPAVEDYPLVPGVNEPGDGTVVYVGPEGLSDEEWEAACEAWEEERK